MITIAIQSQVKQRDQCNRGYRMLKPDERIGSRTLVTKDVRTDRKTRDEPEGAKTFDYVVIVQK